jgi:acyl-CoA synthetase (AMP-forming)/AMP-acid ligase II
VTQGGIGEICVVSPAATESYFGRNAATEQAKVAMNDGQTLHRMGDLGWFDEQQRLWFCGRKSQRLQTADGDRHTVAIEGIFNAHPAVFRSALVGLGPAGDQRALLWVEREADQAISDENLRKELLVLAAQYDQSRCVEKVLFHQSFPVDIRHNAKIGREKLTVLAAKVLA